jgi:hypothetical protein
MASNRKVAFGYVGIVCRIQGMTKSHRTPRARCRARGTSAPRPFPDERIGEITIPLRMTLHVSNRDAFLDEKHDESARLHDSDMRKCEQIADVNDDCSTTRATHRPSPSRQAHRVQIDSVDRPALNPFVRGGV